MKAFVGSLFALTLLAVPAAHAQSPALATDSAHRAMTPAGRRERREEKREERREMKRGTEAHPEIRGAIRSLERAKAELEHASHDFGGHRADALKSVDESLRQLRLALQYDKK